MSLAPKNEKGYLELALFGRGLCVAGKKEHVDELAALYAQYDVPFEREADLRPGEDALHFRGDADKAQVEQVLDSYKNAKGS